MRLAGELCAGAGRVAGPSDEILRRRRVRKSGGSAESSGCEGSQQRRRSDSADENLPGTKSNRCSSEQRRKSSSHQSEEFGIPPLAGRSVWGKGRSFVDVQRVSAGPKNAKGI